MCIKIILKFLFISFLLLYSFYSFTQEKPAILTRPNVQIFDSSNVCEGYVLWAGAMKCSLMDRKGNVMFNFPGNLVSFFENKQEIATHNDDNLIVYNKDMEVLWKDSAIIEHELIVTAENNIMFFSKEYDSINNVNVYFNNIISVDSTGKKSIKWSSFEQRRYLIDFMMKDTNIFRYKIKGSSDPDSVLFKIAPTLGKVWLIPMQWLKLEKPTLDSLFSKGKTQKLPPPSPDSIYNPGEKQETKKKLVLGRIFTKGNDRELFHMNSLQVIPTNKSEEKDSVFRKGNILLSFCNFDDSLGSFMAIVDPVKYKILWYYVQPNGSGIHTPVMLPNGHILVYVNWSSNAPFSCINEIDPVKKKVVWDYNENFPNDELRAMMGSCQRLPNGNTLISNRNGYIYEVTPERKIVWQWLNTADPIEDKYVFVYRALWFSKEKLKWLLNDD